MRQAPLSDKQHRKKAKTMAEEEALDARELDDARSVSAAAKPLTINDLPNDQLVSIFMAIGDQVMVRHTIPLVCKAWAELYRTKDASPLHETLEVDFDKEVARALTDSDEETEDCPRVHASRVISWAQRRAGSVRELHVLKTYNEDLEVFTSGQLGELAAAVASSLAKIDIAFNQNKLLRRPFWNELQAHVVPAGQLRSFRIEGSFADAVECLETFGGGLAGSLEVLELGTKDSELGLPRFPGSFCDLAALRHLHLHGHQEITAIPAEISSLKKLEEMNLINCGLSSLPKELGKLSGLTKLDLLNNSISSLPKELGKLSRLKELDLSGNEDLGEEPVDEAFPAALGKLKSLRELYLGICGLRAVPAFIGKLSRLTRLNLGHNEDLGDEPVDEAFPAALGKLKSLRELYLGICGLRAVPAFIGKLSRLTRLNLGHNEDLGDEPVDEAFPAALGELKSLRELDLTACGLRAVPAFIGELESLEVLNLSWNNNLEIGSPFHLLIEGCPNLREVTIEGCPNLREVTIRDNVEVKLRNEVSLTESEDEFQGGSEGGSRSGSEGEGDE